MRHGDAPGVGSLHVRAPLGSSTWSASPFTDTRSASYLIPVNAEVRRREHIEDGTMASILIELGE